MNGFNVIFDFNAAVIVEAKALNLLSEYLWVKIDLIFAAATVFNSLPGICLFLNVMRWHIDTEVVVHRMIYSKISLDVSLKNFFRTVILKNT